MLLNDRKSRFNHHDSLGRWLGKVQIYLVMNLIFNLHLTTRGLNECLSPFVFQRSCFWCTLSLTTTVCICTSNDDEKYSLHFRKYEGKFRLPNPEPIWQQQKSFFPQPIVYLRSIPFVKHMHVNMGECINHSEITYIHLIKSLFFPGSTIYQRIATENDDGN